MLLPRFDFHEPTSLDEACAMLSGLGEDAKIIAGGTDILVNMKKRATASKNVISLDRIKGLRNIDFSDGLVSMGCQVTAAEVAQSEIINTYFRVLAEGAGSLGSPLIRNRATVVGNVVTARPAGDTLPSLIALKARLILRSKSGERELGVAEFMKGPGETALNPDEIITTILFEKLPPFSGGAYVKLGQRRALEISLVNVASLLILEGEKSSIKDARIVMGAVGPTPLRARKAEKFLLNSTPNEEAFIKAGEIAAGECKPITDHRGSAEYRQAMVAVLTKRTLLQSFERAKKPSTN